MDALPGDQRRAVQARVLEELEYGEIARQTGASEQVIRKRVSRGLATMRRRLSGGLLSADLFRHEMGGWCRRRSAWGEHAA
jgi:DNA-directed RNA polymerase specialized sigma24 family protein